MAWRIKARWDHSNPSGEWVLVPRGRGFGLDGLCRLGIVFWVRRKIVENSFLGSIVDVDVEGVRRSEEGLKKLLKKNRTETTNALDNLQSYFTSLKNGLTAQQIVRGWLHNEPHGIKAIDQSGPNNPKKALRLYVYPDEEAEVLHVFAIGDKESQKEDIARCARTTLEIKKKS